MNPEFIKWLKEQSYCYMSRKGYILIMTKRSRNILTSSWDEITTYYEKIKYYYVSFAISMHHCITHWTTIGGSA
jgi:hypothetical protein